MSLAEDVKLSTCGKHPSLFYLFYFWHCVFQLCLPFKFGGALFYAMPNLTRSLGIVILVTLWTLCHFKFVGGVDIFAIGPFLLFIIFN
jgi:hypothetical protein